MQVLKRYKLFTSFHHQSFTMNTLDQAATDTTPEEIAPASAVPETSVETEPAALNAPDVPVNTDVPVELSPAPIPLPKVPAKRPARRAPAAAKVAAAAEPVAKVVAKAKPKAVVKTAQKVAGKTVSQVTKKAAAKVPAPEPEKTVAAPAPRAAAKSAAKVSRKVAAKSVAKPVVKVAAKATVKASPKAPAKVAAKPVAKKAAQVSAKPALDKAGKAKKTKMVRDSFTIPKPEYDIIASLKHRAGELGNAVKKSELIRAGIKALASMADAAYVAALKVVPTIKTGRPTKR